MNDSPQHRLVLGIILAAALAAWFIALHPPGERVVSVRSLLTPRPSPTPAPGRSATLLFAGDIMLSRSVGDLMAHLGDWTWPFAQTASVTREADLSFANLESVISDEGTVGACAYCFRADPRAIAGLVYAGFDVVSVANNHAQDYGPRALADSVARLASAGIDPVGASGPVTRTVNGNRVTYVAYAYPLDVRKIAAGIAAARSDADILIASFHAGEEYASSHSEEQELAYRAAVDAGADLVIGHHPHVVQDVERYGRGWIAYSLGNFVFDQSFSQATMTGMVLTATVADGRIADIATRSVSISRRYQPMLSR